MSLGNGLAFCLSCPHQGRESAVVRRTKAGRYLTESRATAVTVCDLDDLGGRRSAIRQRVRVSATRRRGRGSTVLRRRNVGRHSHVTAAAAAAAAFSDRGGRGSAIRRRARVSAARRQQAGLPRAGRSPLLVDGRSPDRGQAVSRRPPLFRRRPTTVR